ncbi:MAG: hypothetical protein BJ554DRAFT_6008, partial [Olpidium bornovanus]
PARAHRPGVFAPGVLRPHQSSPPPRLPGLLGARSGGGRTLLGRKCRVRGGGGEGGGEGLGDACEAGRAFSEAALAVKDRIPIPRANGRGGDASENHLGAGFADALKNDARQGRPRRPQREPSPTFSFHPNARRHHP